MNQLSQDTHYRHLHRRPISDPTAMLHHLASSPPNVEGTLHIQSDPQMGMDRKKGNLARLDDEGALRLAKQQSERAHYAAMLEESQVRTRGTWDPTHS